MVKPQLKAWKYLLEMECLDYEGSMFMEEWNKSVNFRKISALRGITLFWDTIFIHYSQ
jgi:hypothetical protein